MIADVTAVPAERRPGPAAAHGLQLPRAQTQIECRLFGRQKRASLFRARRPGDFVVHDHLSLPATYCGIPPPQVHKESIAAEARKGEARKSILLGRARRFGDSRDRITPGTCPQARQRSREAPIGTKPAAAERHPFRTASARQSRTPLRSEVIDDRARNLPDRFALRFASTRRRVKASKPTRIVPPADASGSGFTLTEQGARG